GGIAKGWIGAIGLDDVEEGFDRRRDAVVGALRGVPQLEKAIMKRPLVNAAFHEIADEPVPAAIAHFFSFFLYIASMRWVTRKPPKMLIEAMIRARKPKNLARMEPFSM